MDGDLIGKIATLVADDNASLYARQNTNTTNATTTGLPESSGSGISVGAIVGAAVGALVAGLLVGFIGAWFILKRRNTQSPRIEPLDRSVPAARAPERKAYSPVPGTNSSASTEAELDQFLLDGAPDDEIANELRSLSDLIHQHVENNYDPRPLQANAKDLSRQLQALGFVQSAHHDPDAIAALVLDPKTRQAGLRHVISTVVFKSVDVHSRSPLSMLPAPVAALLQSMPAPGRQSEHIKRVTAHALSNWRRLSAFLLHPDPSQRTSLPPSETIVSVQALALTNALNTFLASFVSSSDASRQGQQEHLQAVIIECTKLGYVLFSHPGDWQFVHGASGRGGVVVCAGLEKLSQRGGVPYKAPKDVVAPVIVEL